MSHVVSPGAPRRQAEGIEVDDSALQSSAIRLGVMTRLLGTLDEQVRLLLIAYDC